MKDKKNDLEDRLVQFAADVSLFSRDLSTDVIGQYYGNQLLRSGGSAALNFGEAQATNSDSDYVHSALISLKKLKVSRVNLRILHKLAHGNKIKRLNLLDEVEQLTEIITTIIKNKNRTQTDEVR